MKKMKLFLKSICEYLGLSNNLKLSLTCKIVLSVAEYCLILKKLFVVIFLSLLDFK